MKRSAAVVLYRRRDGALEVFLVHPGGPFWKNKDDGAWSLPKGEFDDHEPAETAARREFEEETGQPLRGPLRPLTPVVQRGGKVVHPFAIEGDIDAAAIRSNTLLLEWPPRSGVRRSFPEVDRGDWFDLPSAARKILAAQQPVLVELASVIGPGG